MSNGDPVGNMNTRDGEVSLVSLEKRVFGTTE